MPMVDASKLVRRAPHHPLIRLGEGYQPLVAPRAGARFPAHPAKDMDFVLDLESVREAARRR